MHGFPFHKLNCNNIDEPFLAKIRWKLFNKFGIYRFTDLLPYKVKDFYWDKIKPIFKPAHKRVRRAIPRRWYDLDHVLEAVNFEIIKSFYEDEYKRGLVDWTATKDHSDFAKWLEGAYKYITVGRPDLQKKLDASYPEDVFPIEKKLSKASYKKLYGNVEKYEKLIEKKDTELLVELVKNRSRLWT